MNKEMKDNLGKVINSLVNDDSKTASDSLHEYLRAKAQSIILGEEHDMDEKPEMKDEEDVDEKPEMKADADDADEDADDEPVDGDDDEPVDGDDDDVDMEEEEKSKKSKKKDKK